MCCAMRSAKVLSLGDKRVRISTRSQQTIHFSIAVDLREKYDQQRNQARRLLPSPGLPLLAVFINFLKASDFLFDSKYFVILSTHS